MRRSIVGAALIAVAAFVGGCSAEEPAPAPETTTEAPAADGEPIRAAFEAANKAEPWYGDVAELQLDGLAVIVRADVDEPTALDVCEAAYSAAESSKVEFRSVAVRSADDSTLASRNKLDGAAACE